jgi:DNA-binding MarR family transcriptional regulator
MPGQRDTPYSERPRLISEHLDKHFDGVYPLAKRLWVLIVQLSSLFRERNVPTLNSAGIDLSRGEIIILTCLRVSSAPFELRQTEITDRVLLTSGGVTNVCKSLISRGLIERNKDPEDARVSLYRLTGDGKDVIDLVIPIIHASEREISACLSEKEITTTCRILERLTASLQ